MDNNRELEKLKEYLWQSLPHHDEVHVLEAADSFQLCVGQGVAAMHAIRHIFQDVESEAVLSANAFISLNGKASLSQSMNATYGDCTSLNCSTNGQMRQQQLGPSRCLLRLHSSNSFFFVFFSKIVLS